MSSDIEELIPLWNNHEDITLRSKAIHLLVRWTSSISYPDTQDELAQLLGFPGYIDLLRGWNDETRRKVELLIGEHGYVVYRAMLARKEV